MKYYLFIFCFSMVISFIGCSPEIPKEPVPPLLKVSENKRYLEYENGDPFFWLGGTSWGMSEWLNREDVAYYLDNRKAKGFNVVQLCAYFGKRSDDPIQISLHPENPYGFKPFKEVNGKPIPSKPNVKEGTNILEPNDYWDHIDYILQAAAEREMMVAFLPVWGRRYVNATHHITAEKVFTKSDMKTYGKFLGDRYKGYSNLIWVMGGDVKADDGGDFLGHYRAMAEGIITGITKDTVQWNEKSPVWDAALMTYHPDGHPMKNSSLWFHKDAWLDFNMIETFTNIDYLYKAVQEDYNLSDPVKPTVLGEPAYESDAEPYGFFYGIDLRRQAYQSIFAGAAGFTYGGYRDKNGNGPLFSPFKGWKNMLDLEGANSMKFVKAFATKNNWPTWKPIKNVFNELEDKGQLQKLAVASEKDNSLFVYFPDNSAAELDLTAKFENNDNITMQWYNTVTGEYSEKKEQPLINKLIIVQPPLAWTDAILVLSIK